VVTGFFRLDFELSLGRAQDRGDSRVSNSSGRRDKSGEEVTLRNLLGACQIRVGVIDNQAAPARKNRL